MNLIDATSLRLITRLVPIGFIFDTVRIVAPGAYYPNRHIQM